MVSHKSRQSLQDSLGGNRARERKKGGVSNTSKGLPRILTANIPQMSDYHAVSKSPFAKSLSQKGLYVQITLNDVVIGDALTDNAHIDDGYRFHDIFHFAYAAVLGWPL